MCENNNYKNEVTLVDLKYKNTHNAMAPAITRIMSINPNNDPVDSVADESVESTVCCIVSLILFVISVAIRVVRSLVVAYPRSIVPILLSVSLILRSDAALASAYVDIFCWFDSTLVIAFETALVYFVLALLDVSGTASAVLLTASSITCFYLPLNAESISTALKAASPFSAVVPCQITRVPTFDPFIARSIKSFD